MIIYTASAFISFNMCDTGLDVTLLELVKQLQLVISVYQLTEMTL